MLDVIRPTAFDRAKRRSGVMMHGQTPVEMNEANRIFWASEKVQMERRMEDRIILLIAVELSKAEAARRPVYFQSSFNEHLADAESVKPCILGELGRRGGKASKTDPLQKLIEDVVRRQPSITEEKLRYYLKRHGHPIFDICDGTILFCNHDNSEKSAPLSGLKDRLSRAKKKISSRKTG